MDILTLDRLTVGEAGRVCFLKAEGSMRRRMIDLGLVDGTLIECVGKSPSGDPSAYLIRGAVIAIRSFDAATVGVKLCKEEDKTDGTYQ